MVATFEVTFRPDAVVPSRGALVLYRLAPADRLSAAQAADHGFDGGRERATELIVPGDGGRAERREWPVVELGMDPAFRSLLSAADGGGRGRRRPGAALEAWSIAARVAWRLVAAQHVVPSLAMDGDGVVHGVWRALPAADAEAAAVLDRLASALPPAGHAIPLGAGAWAPRDLLGAFCDAVADLAVRAAAPQPAGERPRSRVLPWTARWEEALRDRQDTVVPLREDAPDLLAGVAEWQRGGAAAGGDGLTELRLVAPPSEEGAWRLELGVRTETGDLLRASEVWSPGADGRGAHQETLLAGLGRCARVFPPLEAALSEAVPESVPLDLDQAWSFISEAAPVLEGAGIVVVLPDHLEQGALGIRLRVGTSEDDDDAADTPGQVGYAWEVALAGEALDEEELAALWDRRQPLVHWRGRWVRLDPEEMADARTLGDPGVIELPEALSLALAGIQPAGWDGPTAAGVDAEVVAEGRVADLLSRLRGAADLPAVPTSPDGFVGQLRPYQQRGVAWLYGMGAAGIGGVLADDMGLGKTIQLIGHLLGRGGDGPHLVVCPTSVVGNWERELARFAPGLEVTRHHGPGRATSVSEVKGVYLTTYGTLRRDVDLLAGVRWDVVALDEAQQVKNPGTAAARAARRLSAAHRLALTGTPLENRLMELWSLIDFTNPGLLGTQARFVRRFVTPIERRRDPTAAALLRRLVAPFILRREKTDPAVISDLPDKIERTVVCPLTPEQAERYRAAVDEVFAGGALAGAEAMERRGRILALLTRLKQICNHPAQATGEPQPELVGRSGKLAACRDIVGQATDAGERVLVFTQYVAMGRLLAQQLAADLGTTVPLFHGGAPAAARDRMVARFQDDQDPSCPVLVVSLRAGGTGLNLTAATHVLHYDRWWNPAVEDQATDRAHRIGQTRTVEVHKLVTSGTVEERIAELLESKRALADAVVGAGEAWITELDDEELSELFALGADATIEELDEEPWAPEPYEEAS